MSCLQIDNCCGNCLTAERQIIDYFVYVCKYILHTYDILHTSGYLVDSCEEVGKWYVVRFIFVVPTF